MKKEKLKRLKSLLLAGTMCFTLNGCGKDNNEVKAEEIITYNKQQYFL